MGFEQYSARAGGIQGCTIVSDRLSIVGVGLLGDRSFEILFQPCSSLSEVFSFRVGGFLISHFSLYFFSPSKVARLH